MKISKLVALMALVSGSAQAAYNIYNQDDLSLDINGQINVAAQQEREKFSYLGDADAVGYFFDPATQQYVGEHVLKGTLEERRDRRVRLGQDMGASYLDFRGSQKLEHGLRITGTVGLGYHDSATGMYLSNANVSIDKQNLGAVSVGRQYLHTGFVGRTHTYTPLQTFSANSIRADYLGLKNTHISAYYSFPSSPDVRKVAGQTHGFGVSASHVMPLANGKLRSAIGYSDDHFKSNATETTGDDRLPIRSQGVLASLEYRQGKLLAAADIGKQTQKYEGSIADQSDTNYLGAKVGFLVTPRLEVSAGVGKKDSKRKNIADTSLTCDTTTDPTCSYALDVYSDLLFDQVKESRAYVRMDYYVRENVRLFGRADNYRQTLVHQNKTAVRLDNQEIRAGVSLAF